MGDSGGTKTTGTGRPRLTIIAILAVSVLTGSACTSDTSDDASEPTTGDAADVATTLDDGAAVDTTTAGDEADEETVGSAPPASRADDNPGTTAGDHWIGRNTMTADAIELVWSEVADADAYRIHRFEQGGPGPDAVALDDASLIFDGVATDFTDEQVEEGVFYTYVLDVRTPDGSLPRRWTEGLAMDDTTPPTPITNLRAEINADGVLLSWSPSTDDVEFAAYSVSIVEDDQLRYIGGGADIGQSSFLDTRPGAGTVTYAVQAADFHDNRTEAALIEVTTN